MKKLLAVLTAGIITNSAFAISTTASAPEHVTQHKATSSASHKASSSATHKKKQKHKHHKKAASSTASKTKKTASA